MTPERFRRAQAAFEAVQRCDSADGSAVLDEHCGDDSALRAEVEKLLAQDEDARREGFLEETGLDDALAVLAKPVAQPERIGRYRIDRLLGQGGFGIVYLAHDEQLQRLVAIKVPHARLVSRPEHAQIYLTEARTVAGLDHPNIAAVYDVGSTKDHPFFVVSKFIEGSNLAERIKEKRPSVVEAAELVATVAQTLHYAHRKGLVHRDIKPGNILLEWRAGAVNTPVPYVADFGLALRENKFGKKVGVAGTPAYMSPEQARGEGHRVDGRSDIFSLGVVFYELLTGRCPFHADTLDELLEQIKNTEPRPPRQRDDAIPKELERICLKALSKRASERYTTAKDMADDLRHFLDQAAVGQPDVVQAGVPAFFPQMPTPGSSPSAIPLATPPNTPVSPFTDSQPIKIVPKGLRSFDANDADFFLELLPGPRDREGLPDSTRFWKSRIEETDPEKTFLVGLIYGPSGCGKSSLVKAGLLPRLANNVLAVYVEAAPEETETRLLRGLRKHCPDLPENLGLVATLAALRQGYYLPAAKKVLLVLDQFEQWLHAKRGEENTELVQALRHCDGKRVQCIVMVRDDFWLAVSRFMADMEVELVQGQNMALVDLFDQRHAKKVLAAFGRAFGALPERADGLTKEQKAFLDQAVAGLSQDGKIISVRLALLAEMLKAKPWTPATLKEVGGMEGVGATFLEDTFAASTAPPQHRLHQKAAQAVLKALLPDTGTDIKGNMRSREELLAASGYAFQPKDFNALLRILDSELRLITPTDPQGVDSESPSNTKVLAGQRFYQLTHDYLVPSLRDWLTRRQKETRRGRAELRLGERAALWTAKPENRRLPAWWEWLNIRLLTRKKDWTYSQRKMMRKAARYHAVSGLMVAIVLAAICWAGYETHGTLQARALRDSLLRAETAKVPSIIEEMAPYKAWIVPLLQDASAEARADQDARRQLHTSLALLPVDRGQVAYLYERLLNAQPHEVPVIRSALVSHKQELLDKLWAVVEQPAKGKESQRLRAASALATYDPDNSRWDKTSGPVVEQLVSENPVYLALWMEGFRPVRLRLLPSLADVFNDRKDDRTSERTLATNILADYAADQRPVLAKLVMEADEKQFVVLFPKLKNHGESGLTLLQDEVVKQLPTDAKDDAKETLAQRQANAAVALLKMDRPEKVWPLLKHSPDARVRSYLIHRLGPLGADVKTILKRLDEESDVTIKRALVLSLGEFGEKEWPAGERTALIEKLREIYRTAADPGLHASAEWLLRHWKQDEWLKKTNEEWTSGNELREKRLESIRKELASRGALALEAKSGAQPQWYVNGQGQTMVVIPGPVEFVMGSPTTEAGRQGNEPLHKKRIGRTFAVAAKSVTVEQFRRFAKNYKLPAKFTRTADLPIVGTSWYQAAAYCNWLSKAEKIPEDQWCYGKTKLKENYLSLTGYRLPTEAEMEYATRAGAVTSRYYGEREDLLPKYAWCEKNSNEQTWPVGSLKPNDWGLFDAQGNVFTWCQESYKDYPSEAGDEAVDDKEDTLEIINSSSRVLRGGAFSSAASRVRSANRVDFVPANQTVDFGFRVARTFPTE